MHGKEGNLEVRHKYEIYLKNCENVWDGEGTNYEKLDSTQVMERLEIVDFVILCAQFELIDVVGKHLNLVMQHTEDLLAAMFQEQ